MKCAQCAHKWFQDEPLEKNKSGDEGDDGNGNGNGNGDKGEEVNNDPLLQKFLSDFKDGYTTILIGCVLVIGFFFLYQGFRGSLIVGEGLTFDSIEIVRHGDNIEISGVIINTMNDDRGVPSVKITQLLGNDIEGDSVLIPIHTKVLNAGLEIPFVTTINNVGADVVNFHVGFDMGHDTPQKENIHEDANSDDHEKDDAAHH